MEIEDGLRYLGYLMFTEISWSAMDNEFTYVFDKCGVDSEKYLCSDELEFLNTLDDAFNEVSERFFKTCYGGCGR